MYSGQSGCFFANSTFVQSRCAGFRGCTNLTWVFIRLISDGTPAEMSSCTAAFEQYVPPRTFEGRDVVSLQPAFEVLIRGVFESRSGSWTS